MKLQLFTTLISNPVIEQTSSIVNQTTQKIDTPYVYGYQPNTSSIITNENGASTDANEAVIYFSYAPSTNQSNTK